jgi:hypothetical protein
MFLGRREMTEVIIKGKPMNEVKCDLCESTLRFKEEDVLFHRDPWYTMWGWNYLYIICPSCGQRIVINATVVGREKYNRLCQKFGHKQ